KRSATACGRICLHRKRINTSPVLASQRLGIKEVGDGIWLVSFGHYDLGYFDLEQRTLQPLDNPFGPRLSPMSWVPSLTHVSGPDQGVMVRRRDLNGLEMPVKPRFLAVSIPTAVPTAAEL